MIAPEALHVLRLTAPSSCRRCAAELRVGTVAFRTEDEPTDRYPISRIVCLKCEERGRRIAAANGDATQLRAFFEECAGCAQALPPDKYEYRHAYADGRVLWCINIDHVRAGVFPGVLGSS